MQHQVVSRDTDYTAAERPRTYWRDLAAAAALATLLSICWTIQDWHTLSHLLLPDPDDMMRLAQVRDWLAGQNVNDWTQYRMAPPLGSPMHWSRVNDVGIAALILGFSPLVGRHSAELVAVLAYPALLFTAHLFLAGRIARRMWGAGAAPIAVVLGAVAYPGTTIFAPGRIDHHGLQVVLLEIAILAALHRPTGRSGLAIGAAVALGLVVGLEAVPQTAALLMVVFAFWLVRGETERRRLAGVGIGLAAITAPFFAFLRPTLWSPALCDAFTPATVSATFAGAAALGIMAAATPWCRSWRARVALGAALGAAVLVGTVLSYPACLNGPYGQVAPFLRREFIAHIDEANGIFAQQSFGRAIQLIGVMAASVVGALWVVRRYPARWRRWAPVVAVVLTSGAIALVQIRGIYVGAPVGAPLLAGVVLAARRSNRTLLLIGGWLTCAGIGWQAAPIAAAEMLKPFVRPGFHSADDGALLTLCNTPEAWASMDRFAPGVVMAPTSVAAFLMASTRMSTVGAGYHRNNVGNMAMWRYFLSTPENARRIARRWHVRYVAFCPGDFNEMNARERFPRSLATMLNSDRIPADFHPLPLRGTRLRFYRIAP